MDIIGEADEPDPAGPGQEPAVRRTGIGPADLFLALTDGLVALGATIAVAVAGLVVVTYSAAAHVHGGPGDFLAVAVWLTGASLGVPVRESSSITVADGAPQLMTHGELRAVAWLLTAIVLFLTFRLARRRERGHPSASTAQLISRPVLTALMVTLALLGLAVVTTRASVFGSSADLNLSPSGHDNSRVGLSIGFVFAGPLLLTVAAGLAGVVPWQRFAAGELGRWVLALRLAWRQFLVTSAPTGATLLIYAVVEVARRDDARAIAATVTGLVFLLPNLAIYGALAGFGTTLFGALSFGGFGGQSGPGGAGKAASIGIFGTIRPWIVWLLLGGAVAGVLLPALMTRWPRAGGRAKRRRGRTKRDGGTEGNGGTEGYGGSERSGRLRDQAYPLSGVWRSALIGLFAATAVVLLGALSATLTSSSTSSVRASQGFDYSFRASFSAGPSLLAAAGLTAVWFCFGYLAMSVAARGRRVSETSAED